MGGFVMKATKGWVRCVRIAMRMMEAGLREVSEVGEASMVGCSTRKAKQEEVE